MGFSSTLVRAFCSADLYRTLRREGNFALGYSFKLVALSCYILVIGLLLTAHFGLFAPREGHLPLFDATIRQLTPQLPAMRWESGQLTKRQPGRQLVSLTLNGKNGPENATVLTIDTSGALTEKNAPEGISLTRTQMIQKHGEKTRLISLSQFPLPEKLALDRDDYQRLSEQMVGAVHYYLWGIYAVLGLFVWLCLTLILYVGRVAMLLLVSGILKLVMAVLGEPIRLARLMAVVAVAYTPIALLDVAATLIFFRGTPFYILLPAGLVAGWLALLASERDAALAA